MYVQLCSYAIYVTNVEVVVKLEVGTSGGCAEMSRVLPASVCC